MAITITIRNNGPYFIAPDQVDQVTLVDHEGNVIPRPGRSITLCRCGASATKPFCDGTHSKLGFRAAEAAREAWDREQRAAAPAAAGSPAGASEPGSGPAS